MQTADRVQNADRVFILFSRLIRDDILQLTKRHAIAFPRSSFTIICTIVGYSLPDS